MGCLKLAYYENPAPSKVVCSEKKTHSKKCASYSYFGARYYLSDISVWASVDPLADDYPYQSPYTYCAWNPINVIDPDGMGEDGWFKPKGADHSEFDKNINSQKDLDDRGIKGTFTSKQGGIEYTEQGKVHLMNKDGAEKFFTLTLPEVIVSASRVNSDSKSSNSASSAAIPIALSPTNIFGDLSIILKRAPILCYISLVVNMNDQLIKNMNISTNQLQKKVEQGQAPNEIDRFDKGNPDHGEQDHVHFKNINAALNKNGTWKHGFYDMSNKTKRFLFRFGWKLPK